MNLKKIKTFVAIICSIGVFSSMALTYKTYAEETTTIKIEGNEEGIITIPNTDDFLKKDNMLPGDTVKGEIQLQNNYQYPYRIYIRAEENQKMSSVSFLEKLMLDIKIGEKEIYSGNLSGEDSMSKDIYIGTINPGQSVVLNAMVTLDGKSVGNEYKNQYASVDWIFTANREEVLGGDEEDPKDEGTLGDSEFDNGVLGKIETGDSNKIILLSLAIISCSLVVIVVSQKRRDYK